MKQGIHPQWNHQALVTCGCGATFTTGSMQDSITVDICSSCHPFFTGEMRFVDRQGRVDKFMQKMNLAQQKQAAQKAKKASQKATPTDDDSDEKETDEQLSYKQVLQKEQTKLKNVTKLKTVAQPKLQAAA